MAISTFPAAGADGGNDLGGKVLLSAQNIDASVAIGLNNTLPTGSYVIDLRGGADAAISVLGELADGSLLELLSINQSSSGSSSWVVEIPDTIQKIVIAGLAGTVTISEFAAPDDLFSVNPTGPTGFNTVAIGNFETGTPSNDYRSWENDTHWFLVSNGNNGTVGFAMAINKQTKLTQPLFDQFNNPRYVAGFGALGVKDGLVISSQAPFGGGTSSTQIQKVSYNASTDQWIGSGSPVTAFSSSGNISVVYIPTLDRFVAANNNSAETALRYSDDDGATWSVGGVRSSAARTSLRWDSEAEVLLVSERPGLSQSVLQYSTDGGVTLQNWSLPSAQTSWYLPQYNAAGGFWTLTHTNYGSFWTATTLGGAWTLRSTGFNTPSGLTYPPVAHNGVTVIPSSAMLNSGSTGNVAIYSTDGTTWTGQAYTAQVDPKNTNNTSNALAVKDGPYIKWLRNGGISLVFNTQDNSFSLNSPFTDGNSSLVMGVSPDGNYIARGVTNGVMVSSDGGHTWRYVNLSFTSNGVDWFNGSFWCSRSNSRTVAILSPDDPAQNTWTFTYNFSIGTSNSPGGFAAWGDQYAFYANANSTVAQNTVTADGGATWTSVSNSSPFIFPTASNEGPGIFYVFKLTSTTAWFRVDANTAAATFVSGTPSSSNGPAIPYKNGMMFGFLTGVSVIFYYISGGVATQVGNIDMSIAASNGSFSTSVSRVALFSAAGILYLVAHNSNSGNQFLFASKQDGATGSWVKVAEGVPDFNKSSSTAITPMRSDYPYSNAALAGVFDGKKFIVSRENGSSTSSQNIFAAKAPYYLSAKLGPV